MHSVAGDTRTASGVAAEERVRVMGVDFVRFAVVHHSGATPKSGHYTATVATSTGAYFCDDYKPPRHLGPVDAAWGNSYLVFLQKSVVDGAAPSHSAGAQDETFADAEAPPAAEPDKADAI